MSGWYNCEGARANLAGEKLTDLPGMGMAIYIRGGEILC